VDDTAAAEGLLDLVESELRAYSTKEDQRLTDRQSELVIRTLEAVTKRLGMPIGLPFRSFGTFRGFWESRGARGNGAWERRRRLVDELFGPARKRLDALKAGLGGPTIDEELIANLREPTAIKEHLDRLQRSAYDDPALAIGIAKELVESTAKTVLSERGLPVNDKDDLPALVSKSQLALELHPSSGHAGPDSTDAVKRILGGLMTLTTGLGELRNRGYGTGHGPAGKRIGLRPRHARLAVNTAVTWCNFMLDTLADPKAPWRAKR
jgi:Abortive infection C-terminus